MQPIKYRCHIKTVNNTIFNNYIGRTIYCDDGNGFRFIMSPVGGNYIERLYPEDSLTLTEDPWDQFTGLLDKNGKEIYTGDWLGVPSSMSKVRYDIRRGALFIGWTRLNAYRASKLEIVEVPKLLTK